MIDHAFIEAREGGLELVGYVPVSEKSQSGVTVGCGVDLGQRDEAELERWGCSAGLVDQLRPYLGLKKEMAAAALELAPLKVTKEDARFLSIAARGSITETLASLYERDAGGSFFDLPPAAQTVIASVAYQYGPNLYLPAGKGGAPKFWRLACRRDWPGLVQELEHFGDSYPSRRNIEAGYLKAGLAAG
ncbi:pesticin C-terminus-like muramidase [Nisaea nitritireducens]|uniref:pesticin C-terminus-like muramidase n=1 Tax=Nisaea nitritireducens TaxID=568392 RepID=UPI001867E630|nr:pesticin C-terminus-like muramidase [Nisaea nitritireducens]